MIRLPRYRSRRVPISARRAAFAIADQAAYSGTNFFLTILVAREVSPRAFGAFSVVLAASILILGVMRGVTSEPFIVRFSAGHPHWKDHARAAYGATLAAGCVLGLITAFVGLVVTGTLGRLTIEFGVLLPGLLVQDTFRYLMLARGRPEFALINDVVVAVVQFPLAVVLIEAGRATATTLLAAWGAGAWVAVGVAIAIHRIYPNPFLAKKWITEHWHLASRYALDDLLGIGAVQVTSFVVAGVAGLAAAGGLRAAQTLFGPLLVINSGVTAAIVPEMIRIRASRGPARMNKVVVVSACALAVVACIWGIVALALPTGAGSALFGRTWPDARGLLAYLLIAQVAYGIRVAPTAALRALGAANRSVAARFWGTIVGLALPLAGAFAGGARGAVIALAVAAPLQAALYWWQYQIARAQVRASQDASEAGSKWGQTYWATATPEPPESTFKL